MPAKACAGVLIASGIGACAGPNAASTASIAPPTPLATSQQVAATTTAPSCKDITGRMQVRILDLRGQSSADTTALSRAFQSGFGSIFGSTSGGDKTGRAANERAELVAWNDQLAAMGCKRFDLDSVLTEQNIKMTPEPTIAATAKPDA